MGSDVCGYNGETTPELCARWTVLSAVYPFARNNNNIDVTVEQYPFSPLFSQSYKVGGPTYTEIMRGGMLKKYALLRYSYSSLMGLTSTGGQFIKPLFYEFPTDAMAWENEGNNFMMGESVKISVLSDALGQDTTDFYFPEGWWCDVFNTAANPCFKSAGGPKGQPTPTDMGGVRNLPSTPSDLHVHLREGRVLPMHDLAKIDTMKIASIDALNKNLMTDFYANPLIAPPDETARTYWSVSLDSLYNDDGISLAPAGASSLKV